MIFNFLNLKFVYTALERQTFAEQTVAVGNY